MNINSTQIGRTQETPAQNTKQVQEDNSGKFAEELKSIKTDSTKTEKEKETVPVEKQEAEKNKSETEKSQEKEVQQDLNSSATEETNKNQAVELDNKPDEVAIAIDGLTSLVKEFHQSDDKLIIPVKNVQENADNDEEGEELINNEFNINENKEILPQMNPNMNFGGDGQPFSSFMNNEAEQRSDKVQLSSSAKDLAEEAAVLSTMAENIAMANKANLAVNEAEKIEQPAERMITKEDGIKKVDTKTNIVQETIVKYDTVVMNEADVEVFANLVENGEVNMNNLAPQAAEKSVHVSKTLADMLAKAMEDNKPVRIEFDNNISVIIRISRDGKLTADFLPSSQVAEAYLKENLPLLKQRFDEQGIEYDSLNQRERKEQDREQSRKKGRDDE